MTTDEDMIIDGLEDENYKNLEPVTMFEPEYEITFITRTYFGKNGFYILSEVKNDTTVFYNKYENSISNPLSPLKDIEPIACQFLTEYAEYIIALSNKQISLPTIIEAAKVVKEKIDGYDKEKIDEWMKKTIEDNLLISARAFPYHYDPNNQTEAYLTSVDEKPEIKENKTR